MSDAARPCDAPLVVGVGEVLWDLLPHGPVLGGAPANFACQARRLGARAAVIGAVGADALGERARNRLEALGVDHRALATVSHRVTGTVDVFVGQDGEPSYRIAEPAAWDFIPLTADACALALTADAICYGSLAQRRAPSRASIGAIVDAARPSCLRVFDVNLRYPWFDPDVIVSSLGRSSVVKLNESELDVLADVLGLDGAESVRLEQLAVRYRLRLVALTKGRAGCRVFAGGQHEEHPGFPVDDVVDTVGAGDAFSAALVVGMWRRLPLRAIAETSNRVASLVCRQAGASASMGSVS